MNKHMNEVKSLCRRVETLMSQTDIVGSIMKGRRRNNARYIGIMKISTTRELKTNIRKHKKLELTITGQTSQFPSETINLFLRNSLEINH